jgi:hypothetical protein
MASGNPNKAISDFNHALELQHDFPQASVNRGNAYLRLGHLGLAFADFRQGGTNPVKIIAILCGIPAIMILLGVFMINVVRQRLLAARQRTIELE